jgi:threonyl-tRNA synthetase
MRYRFCQSPHPQAKSPTPDTLQEVRMSEAAVAEKNSDAQNNEDRLYRICHTVAHVMAEAVLRKFPEAKIAIGPPIENGFYYDFDLPRPLKEEDLPELEAEMQEIVKGKYDLQRQVISRDEAKERFSDQPYKLELVDAIPAGDEVSLYTVDEFTDLCRGPHVENTRDINWKSFKLLRIAGAYWRGDSTRPMLTRIYGTAWEDPKQLRQYLEHLKEIEKRDHRNLGRDLELFHIEDENPGQIFWHPKGWSIYLEIQEYVRRKIAAQGYKEVNTPAVMPKTLWERSGHWEKYKENMFVTESEKREFALKPMNCPGHIEIFKKGLKSYRDLPLRIAEFGSCTRDEPSGALHGIMRVRGFVQDDAHIFCSEDQIGDEVTLFVKLLQEMYADFGFGEENIIVKFSTRPEKRVGDDATWDRAEAALEAACRQAKLDYEVAEGEGAFYGPKLEFTLVDAMGRHWQCGTIQVDYQLPSAERLNASYIGEDGEKHTPVLLHRVVLGSLERFIGILIEQYAGAFPVWLAPRQAVVIPVGPAFEEGAAEVAAELEAAGLRVNADLSDARMNAKIRKHQKQKVPYMLIIGEKEISEGTVSIRTRTNEQMNDMPLAEFITFAKDKIESKAQL